MAKRRPRDLLLPAGLIVGMIGLGWGTVALAQGTIPGLTSTPITFAGHADAFVAGPDGNVWLVDYNANAIGRLSADGYAYQAFPVPTAAAGVNSIAAGSDGNLWFTESLVSKVGRITTAGAITEFTLPPAFHFPLYSFSGTSGTVAAGPDGNLWISGVGQMARVTPQGSVTVVTVPPPAGIDQVDIGKCVAGSDGAFWCLSAAQVHGLYDYRVAKLTTAGGVTLYPVTLQEFDIVEAPDGNVWISAGSFPDWNLTRVTPAGVETVYSLPTTRESRLDVGADGNIWFTERTTMGNIWQMILSSATDDGHAEFNTAPIGLGYPEQIVAIRPPAGALSIRPLETKPPCPPGINLAVGSSAAYSANLFWAETARPTTCTDLLAFEENTRFEHASFWGCHAKFDSPNRAQSVHLEVRFPRFTEIRSVSQAAWDSCKPPTTPPGQGPVVTCDTAFMDPGNTVRAKIEAVYEGSLDPVVIKCSSATPEIEPSDNTYRLYSFIPSLPPLDSAPVNVENR